MSKIAAEQQGELLRCKGLRTGSWTAEMPGKGGCRGGFNDDD
jgi:hypothetical protein